MTPTEPHRSIASNRSLNTKYSEAGREAVEGPWSRIERTERLAPFLMSLVSDGDHWLYVTSTGALTAGRGNPDRALFPYYTQDKLEDMRGKSGGRLVVRMAGEGDGDPVIWEPYCPAIRAESGVRRAVSKNELGNHIILEEEQRVHGLKVLTSWRPGRRFGFIRRQELVNMGTDAVELEVLDGFLNLLPHGLEQRFQNEFSILGDAYKQAELEADSGMGIYHLSSLPTDLAVPMESLRATVAWQSGLDPQARLLSDEQAAAFCGGASLKSETTMRGRRGAFQVVARLRLEPGESRVWHTCADVAMDVAGIESLRANLLGNGDLAAAIEEDARMTEERLRTMLAGADGFQRTGNRRQTLRHTSNTMFNLMRGGALVTGYDLPGEDLLRTVRHFNREAARELEGLRERTGPLRCQDPWNPEHPLSEAGKDLRRLLREYLPLTFSRRHGDPSRPWNRFDIVIRESDGSPRYAYQGNWRDIFQNWEALLHSWPEYLEAAISRFLNASTADGYNPYRLTKEGYDWETLDPDDPWANIGYWGDHQIIYLLRLLEASHRFHPERLSALLEEEAYVYAEIPYRIRDYKEILANPRETIDYDTDWEARIHERVREVGADGKLMPHPEGGLNTVSLMEKLLNPLVSKLSNFIPGGGIWMNTQRPEWNDANNALVGYGISVVTLGYVARYLDFLLTCFEEALQTGDFSISRELAAVIDRQIETFSQEDLAATPEERLAMMEALGESASAFRRQLYDGGLSGEKVSLEGKRVRNYLEAARRHVLASLAANRREDGLWHSYNLLRIDGNGAHIRHLQVMLEGQVSILSSGTLDEASVLKLLRALPESDLYRPDQDSYILYPDRELPALLDKNRIPATGVEAVPILKALADAGDTRIIKQRDSGDYAFAADIHNVEDLKRALQSVGSESGIASVTEKGMAPVLELYEQAFNHHAFTGRSGTFFAYEGLGSIYWHMVSKLVLAVQELLHPDALPLQPEAREEIATAFHRFRRGLGIEKDPAEYGAFPTDAYSHTPAHAGAQQPGMTGQVKEDILIRLTELGVRIDKGEIHFDPNHLPPSEFLDTPTVFILPGVNGGNIRLNLPADSLAYTFCQVPVVYYRGRGKTGIRVLSNEPYESRERRIPADISREIFNHTGSVKRIEVDLD
jgi:hypothetical protein